MEPIINLEEESGKTVGRRVPPSDALAQEASRKATAEEWARAFQTASIPKGVYRFRTHEEADAWMWKMITRQKDR